MLKYSSFIVVIRWTARILGILCLGLFLLFLVGEGGFNPFHLTMIELLMTLCLLIVLIGILVAWKKEGWGGAIMVGSIILFYLINFAGSRKFPGGWVFPVLLVPGVLFLICWFLTKVKQVER
jgi:hypothetical protein